MLYNKEDIDFEAWDNFVLEKGGTIFSTTTYLQACAENWMVFWEKDKSFGMALPFTEKLGVKTLYQPFFSRYQEFLGNPPDLNAMLNVLKSKFHRSLMSLRMANYDQGLKAFVYQEIDFKNRKLSTNAKRQIKKFTQLDYELTAAVPNKELSNLIKKELGEKLAVFSGKERFIFERLILGLQTKKQIKSIAIKESGNLVGGVFYMEFGNRLIYLKGACAKVVKQNGGMYFLLHSLIEKAENTNKIFDFGGSRVDAVRTFNRKLGGIDKKYIALHWDNSPIWFKLAQRIRAWIKK